MVFLSGPPGSRREFLYTRQATTTVATTNVTTESQPKWKYWWTEVEAGRRFGVHYVGVTYSVMDWAQGLGRMGLSSP